MSKHPSETAPADHPQAVPGAHRQQVLQWLVDGLDVPTIARRINRKPQVVQRHVDELLKRLGVATPAEALEKLAQGAGLPGASSTPEGAEPSASDAVAPQPAAAG